ncbi:MAG: 3-oxoacyl-[acyl-carrier-protein] reductase FabG [Chlamydiales bacterium]|nr:3-oxoacyl-[acyl-carrier-protein] reductase FabG [Chlamydiales bacterium]MCH9620482.1 3-oxoacyl-[acyl-carrier-protein] reductase FabG [Chlamydiales bacterium]MCH9623467.1 3-oxoacyl-[acyl-carrier-protein] reductase FabG [Chlamydiales bacterium]
MILVTGGARQLGAAICKKLAGLGKRVVIHYNTSQKEAVELSKQCPHSEIIQGDFTHGLEDFIRRYKKHFPSTEGLINNVGNFALGKASSITTLDPLLQTNLTAPILLTNALLPSVKKNKGSIVNIGTSGLCNPWVRATPFGLTKAALLFYTRSLAKELAPFNVSVNMISPGQLKHSEDLPQKLPMGRAGTVEEVADLIATLLEQKYITGQNIEIAGGYSF